MRVSLGLTAGLLLVVAGISTTLGIMTYSTNAASQAEEQATARGGEKASNQQPTSDNVGADDDKKREYPESQLPAGLAQGSRVAASTSKAGGQKLRIPQAVAEMVMQAKRMRNAYVKFEDEWKLVNSNLGRARILKAAAVKLAYATEAEFPSERAKAIAECNQKLRSLEKNRQNSLTRSIPNGEDARAIFRLSHIQPGKLVNRDGGKVDHQLIGLAIGQIEFVLGALNSDDRRVRSSQAIRQLKRLTRQRLNALGQRRRPLMNLTGSYADHFEKLPLALLPYKNCSIVGDVKRHLSHRMQSASATLLDKASFEVDWIISDFESKSRTPSSYESFLNYLVAYASAQISQITRYEQSGSVMPREYFEQLRQIRRLHYLFTELKAVAAGLRVGNGNRLISPADELRILKNGDAAAALSKKLDERIAILKKSAAELTARSPKSGFHNEWRRLNLRNIEYWRTVKFPKDLKYRGQPIAVELTTYRGGKSAQARGRRDRGRERGGRVEPPIWRVRIGDRKTVYLTIATPMELEYSNRSSRLRSTLVGYERPTGGTLIQLDTMYGIPLEKSGIRNCSLNQQYDPKAAFADGFHPCYVSFDHEGYSFAVVVAQIGPGTADVDLVELLRILFNA